jgi:predicted HicB family RNase H-like nuclease
MVKTVKFPDVRVSPKLKAETEKAAEFEQENLSEYIRKAVEERNKRVAKEGKG